MSTAYGISNCVGWYRAGVGVYKDAGSTPAAHGDTVQQWNDQSGTGNHLTQSTSANRPSLSTYLTAGPITSNFISPYGPTLNYFGADQPAGIYFDGASTFLNIPSSLALTSTGATIILCTRGSYYIPVGFGTDATYFIGYGWFGGSPSHMGMQNGSERPFSKSTFLPLLAPMVHGFRASGSAGATNLYMGTNQTDVQNTNWVNFSTSGGYVGKMQGLLNGQTPNFNGEVLELAIFNTPLSDSQVAQILSQMQDANGIRSDANNTLVAFVGDSQSAGGPGTVSFNNCYEYQLCRMYGQSFKPLSLAYPGSTLAEQLSLVQNEFATLDLTPFSKIVAICCCGINDIAHYAFTDTQGASALSTLASAITSISGAQLIVAVPPHQDSGTIVTSGELTYLHNYQAWIRSNWRSIGAAALLDWTTDPRLANASTDGTYWADELHTTETGDRVKAALTKPVLDSVLASGSSNSEAMLAFGAFYLPGNSFTANFGRFIRS